MARINTTQLIHIANLGHCAYQVQQDPAVRKAWSEAGYDFGKASRSVAKAAFETRSAWCRAGVGGGTDSIRLLG